jgi:glycosyltransferase involved in cell wall biosynthesis
MIIISIGYGRTLFNEGDQERARLLSCAQAAGEVHHIVFAPSHHGLSSQSIEGALFLYPTNAKTRIGMFLAALRLGHSLARRFPQAVVTAQDPLAAGLVGYILARTAGRLLVLQEHGDIFSGNYWRHEALSHRVWYPIARFLIRRADRVRVVSRRVAAHVAALGVSAERIRSLSVFSDLHAMQAHEVKEDLRATYPHASPLILSVARFVPQKNLSLLLRAVKALRTQHPQAALVLVGRGPLERALRAEAQALGIHDAVHIQPWASDVASLMKTADIYALSSNYEGWARVLPEAMACGLPAVTTDVGCAGEVFIHEQHGLVVPVGDAPAFAQALISLTEDLTRRDAFKASERAATRGLSASYTAYAEAWAQLFSL